LVGVDDKTTGDYENNVLPEDWNKNGPSHYTLKYRHEQSSLEFIIKVSKLGSRTMINAIAAESDKAASLDISTADFTSESFFPHDLTSSDAAPLIHGFISSARVSDLTSQLKLKIFQKLVPGLRKEGYSEVSEEQTTASTSQPQRNQNPPPARPRPDVPPEGPEQPFQPYSHIPPQNPLEIGRRDRDPFPMGANPFAPPPLFPGSGGDGMFVGPDHPIFWWACRQAAWRPTARSVGWGRVFTAYGRSAGREVRPYRTVAWRSPRSFPWRPPTGGRTWWA
jgi:hypothetical protein